MKDHKEKWIREVLDSTKGSQRAKPKRDLFAKIERRIYQSQAKVIPLFQLRIAVAVAVILCLMNVSILYQQIQSNSNQELVIDRTSNHQLISNYNLYD